MSDVFVPNMPSGGGAITVWDNYYSETYSDKQAHLVYATEVPPDNCFIVFAYCAVKRNDSSMASVANVWGVQADGMSWSGESNAIYLLIEWPLNSWNCYASSSVYACSYIKLRVVGLCQ